MFKSLMTQVDRLLGRGVIDDQMYDELEEALISADTHVVGGAFPSEGNFIAFVGPSSSGELVERCTALFRAASEVPAEGAALPTLVPRINSSDHWSFWKQGWPALMVTDTAPYRDAAYHTPQDTPERLNYERMARVVEGLGEVVRSLAGEAQPPAIDRMVAR